MRIGLIAALARTPEGGLRAQLPMAGRSVLAWQVDLMQTVGAERIICLCESTSGAVLGLQHAVEARGGSFHLLNGFAALPALVRAEDELIVLRDGLVPDPALIGLAPDKSILCIAADHPFAIEQSGDFERIDAQRHWAGWLMMRGSPVQQLADFPADADATSVLLRLALQAGTPCRELAGDKVTPASWLLAANEQAVRAHETALMAHAAPPMNWRAPLSALAALVVRKIVPRGLGDGARLTAGLALALSLVGVILAALDMQGAGLGMAALGAFVVTMAAGFTAMTARLRRLNTPHRGGVALADAIDVLSALTVWFALSPWPDFAPLAICGPLVIGLVRLAQQTGNATLGAIASDRSALLLVLTVTAAIGLLPHAVALMAAVLLAALLLNSRPD